MKAIAIVGFKKSGKTTLVENLACILARSGKVGTIKHVPHHEIDESGDTRRHRVAGAEVVIAVTPESLVTVEPRDADEDIAISRALSRLQHRGVDFALVEGFKTSRLPKVTLGKVEAGNVVIRVDGEPDVDAIADFIMGMEDYAPEE